MFKKNPNPTKNESIHDLVAITNKEELYLWHCKHTPWFDSKILQKITDLEWIELEKERMEKEFETKNIIINN